MKVYRNSPFIEITLAHKLSVAGDFLFIGVSTHLYVGG